MNSFTTSSSHNNNNNYANPSRHISIDSAAVPIASHASLGLQASQVGLFSRVLNENFNKETASKSVVSVDVKDDPNDRLEFRLKMKDLEDLKNAFDSYKTSEDDEPVKLNKSEFVHFMTAHLNKGTQKEYEELFDNIDVSQSGRVDFDEFTSYLLIMLYETDDRHTKLSIPNWKPIKQIYNVHRDTIQRIDHLKSLNRYLTISKEGCCCLYDKNLHLVNNTKLNTESCKSKDLWVTDFIILQNVNKLVISYTTKEIEIHELNTKLEFNPIYKIYNLKAIPLCLDYWYDPANPNDSILCWGDTAGCVHTIHFNSSLIALFERSSSNTNQSNKSQSSSSETTNICLDINIDEIKLIYKNAMYIHFKAHTAWVRQVKWIKNLDCVMSCASTSKQSICMGWFQRKSAHIRVNYSVPIRVHEKTTHLNIVNGGVNAFDFDSKMNLLATANQNTLVNLFNPYVLEPTGVLKGHSRAVLAARFLPGRSQLISFSADKILRVWNVQLQICIQKVSNSFPKGPDVDISCFFDDTHSRFFIAFRFSLFMMEIKPEVTNRVTTHSGSVMAVKFNKHSNQVVTLSQDGTVFIWLIESGQKIKTFTSLHGNAELLTLDFDESNTRFYTGSADGTIKIWDFNGHCHHTLVVNEGQNCEITQILNLKRRILALGWKRDVTVFRDNTMKEERVEPSEWNAKQTVHDEDILCAAVMSVPPMLLATGGFDGLIVIWNSVSELPSKFLTARRKLMVPKDKSNNGTTAPSSPSKSRLHSRQASRQQSERTFLTQHSAADQGEGGNKNNQKAHSAATTESDSGDDYGCSITCLRFLNSRVYSKDCVLVSCGGNGWVRFWEVASGHVGGEFIAHARVNSIIMEVDETDKYLATGDLNGLVKIWDISDYCLGQSDCVAGVEPPLFSTIQSHNDSINSICFYKKSDKQTYVLLGSSDCSVSLNDLNGTLLGIFGQETHWRMDSNPNATGSLIVPSIVVSHDHIGEQLEGDEKTTHNNNNETAKVEQVVVTSLSSGEHLIDQSILVDGGAAASDRSVISEDQLILPKLNQNFRIESTFEYERDAFVNDTQLRYNPWSKTILGRTYQDARVKKRDRRQPSHVKSEEFERWEKTGQVRGGLYGSLHIVDMDEDAKSDKIMAKILSDRKTTNQDGKGQKLKNPADNLRSAFDEKTLFPKYILDYEARMRQEHKIILAKLANNSTTTNSNTTTTAATATGSSSNQQLNNKSQTSNNESASFLISRKKRNSYVSTS